MLTRKNSIMIEIFKRKKPFQIESSLDETIYLLKNSVKIHSNKEMYTLFIPYKNIQSISNSKHSITIGFSTFKKHIGIEEEKYIELFINKLLEKINKTN